MLILSAGKGRARNILDQAVQKLGLADPDRSFLTELVYGTIRWRGNLDWVIGQFVQPASLGKFQPEVVEILRLGLYQLLFLSSVPDYAAVSESVELAKIYGGRGSAGLVNAVLRQTIRNREKITYPDINSDPVGHISVRYSHPKWLVERWVRRYGVDETVQICSANNLRPPLYVRTNVLKTSRERLIRSLNESGAKALESCNIGESVEIIELPLPISELSSYKLGWFQVQDESSMLVSHILDPQPGETIIDACSAPGGKATHIAELMQNMGKVLAFDLNARRLSMLRETCQRLGITIVESAEADARKLGGHAPKEKVDRALVDAPCTGLGVLRRRVEARWRRTPEQLQTFPEMQYQILENVARYIKPGGVLVYCTCTTEPEENQQVVERFLEAHKEFQSQSVQPFLPEKIKEFKNLVSGEGYMQTYPHLHNMDGLFAVRMVKIPG